MLKTNLNTLPYTKFILIEDSLEQRGKDIFDHLLKNHLSRTENKVNYFVFEGNFKKAKQQYANKSNMILYDFVSNPMNWIDNTEENFEKTVSKLGANDIVIIDSLLNLVFQCGLAETYRIFNKLKYYQDVSQLIAVLHKDLQRKDDRTLQYFEHLSTLSLNIEPNFNSENNRIQYTYKKTGGKIIKQIEEYRFEGENLITQKIEKPDPKKLIEKSIPPEINPENLSTFRIGLTEKEKESRNKVVLPYLPKTENEKEPIETGRIFYQLDAVDDWDEEDPDDDLDI